MFFKTTTQMLYSGILNPNSSPPVINFSSLDNLSGLWIFDFLPIQSLIIFTVGDLKFPVFGDILYYIIFQSVWNTKLYGENEFSKVGALKSLMDHWTNLKM